MNEEDMKAIEEALEELERAYQSGELRDELSQLIMQAVEPFMHISTVKEFRNIARNECVSYSEFFGSVGIGLTSESMNTRPDITATGLIKLEFSTLVATMIERTLVEVKDIDTFDDDLIDEIITPEVMGKILITNFVVIAKKLNLDV